jgi:hypothetical protein
MNMTVNFFIFYKKNFFGIDQKRGLLFKVIFLLFYCFDSDDISFNFQTFCWVSLKRSSDNSTCFLALSHIDRFYRNTLTLFNVL